ncbi:GD16753 [Drosophila simulans]|uniref:GD16753 n=1 Tax=Drosophila simulans TaxID=7240 RepID=B4R534_DROSI|nr:GD16753 [Drosophila simulans]
MFDRSLIPTGGASVSRVSTFTERHHRRVQLSRNKLYLQRLSRATSLVHKQPPLMNVKTQSGFDVLHEDARIFLERTNANVRLLLNLSKIKRTKGTIDFAEGPPVVPQSALPQMLRRLDRVQRHNLWLGLRLMRIHERKREGDQRKREGEKRTSEQSQSSNLRCSSVMTNRSALGENEVFNKYIGWDLEMPDEYLELIRLLRPRIVLHFGLMDTAVGPSGCAAIY